jgi:mono/diheme cytochrome c family protein
LASVIANAKSGFTPIAAYDGLTHKFDPTHNHQSWYPMGSRSRLAILLLLSLATGYQVHPVAASDISRGKLLAERTCGGCHDTNGVADNRAQGIPAFRNIAGQPINTPERLSAFLMIPHRPMPALPLDASEISDIVAYIVSLK